MMEKEKEFDWWYFQKNVNFTSDHCFTLLRVGFIKQHVVEVIFDEKE